MTGATPPRRFHDRCHLPGKLRSSVTLTNLLRYTRQRNSVTGTATRSAFRFDSLCWPTSFPTHTYYRLTIHPSSIRKPEAFPFFFPPFRIELVSQLKLNSTPERKTDPSIDRPEAERFSSSPRVRIERRNFICRRICVEFHVSSAIWPDRRRLIFREGLRFLLYRDGIPLTVLHKRLCCFVDSSSINNDFYRARIYTAVIIDNRIVESKSIIREFRV